MGVLTGNASNTTVYGSIPNLYVEYDYSKKRNTTYGFAFPPGKNNHIGGFFNKASDINLVRGAVKQLLLTERGERLMLPDFGCDLQKFLFQPLDEDLFLAIKQEIITSFYKYIKGAEIIKIAVFPTEDNSSLSEHGLTVVLSLSFDDSELSITEVEVNIV